MARHGRWQEAESWPSPAPELSTMTTTTTMCAAQAGGPSTLPTPLWAGLLLSETKAGRAGAGPDGTFQSCEVSALQQPRDTLSDQEPEARRALGRFWGRWQVSLAGAFAGARLPGIWRSPHGGPRVPPIASVGSCPHPEGGPYHQPLPCSSPHTPASVPGWAALSRTEGAPRRWTFQF